VRRRGALALLASRVAPPLRPRHRRAAAGTLAAMLGDRARAGAFLAAPPLGRGPLWPRKGFGMRLRRRPRIRATFPSPARGP